MAKLPAASACAPVERFVKTLFPRRDFRPQTLVACTAVRGPQALPLVVSASEVPTGSIPASASRLAAALDVVIVPSASPPASELA